MLEIQRINCKWKSHKHKICLTNIRREPPNSSGKLAFQLGKILFLYLTGWEEKKLYSSLVRILKPFPNPMLIPVSVNLIIYWKPCKVAF